MIQLWSSFIGRMPAEKNLEALFQTFESIRFQIEGVRLMLVGHGPMAEAQVSLARGEAQAQQLIQAGFTPKSLSTRRSKNGMAIYPSLWAATPWVALTSSR